MKKIVDLINRHKALTICIALLLFVVQPIVVHWMFKTPAATPFWEKTWEAGDLLGYIAGFEAFLGTVFLGVVATRQNDKANELNELMLYKEAERDAFERQPVLRVGAESAKINLLNEIIKKDENPNSLLFIETPPSNTHFEEYQKDDMIYLSFEVTNEGKTQIYAIMQNLSVKRSLSNAEKSIALFDLNAVNPTKIFNPGSSIVYRFAIHYDDFYIDASYTYKFNFILTNVIHENFVYELSFYSRIINTNRIVAFKVDSFSLKFINTSPFVTS